jgi:hypothetical protein
MLGSILSNILLVLGCSFLAGKGLTLLRDNRDSPYMHQGDYTSQKDFSMILELKRKSSFLSFKILG